VGGDGGRDSVAAEGQTSEIHPVVFPASTVVQSEGADAGIEVGGPEEVVVKASGCV
jgi:hypothetical protein